ncbi:MAG: hypothetical protein ACXVFI_18315 [Solirubrobacteraceae bacterium]
MHNIDDETRREILGEALMDELKAIHDYVRDVPEIKAEVHQVRMKVDEMNLRLDVIEMVVREHDRDIRGLKQKAS